MVSASTGWALIFTSNPSNSSVLAVARTADGGRTWALVTPAAPRGSFVQGTTVLDAASAQRAWVVGVTPGHKSVIFGTVDAGRSWWRSEAVAAAQPVAVDFASRSRGWLLESMGAAMGSNPVRVYRTADGGLRWSLAAMSQASGEAAANGSGLPVECGKVGISFSSPQAGWIATRCNLGYSILVSRDGGAHWASKQLPIPRSACEQGGCEISEPQFAGNTTFLEMSDYPDAAFLFVSRDAGASWRTIVMPSGAGPYPRVQFFGPAEGIAVSAGPQGSIGRDFYLTSDGGLTWTPVRQGRHFGLSGPSFDFASPAIGFAWVAGADSTGSVPSMYRTSDSGRTWTAFVPHLS
jgi:photosystem II stability/assembly factor-like uncharacterized protein